MNEPKVSAYLSQWVRRHLLRYRIRDCRARLPSFLPSSRPEITNPTESLALQLARIEWTEATLGLWAAAVPVGALDVHLLTLEIGNGPARRGARSLGLSRPVRPFTRCQS